MVGEDVRRVRIMLGGPAQLTDGAVGSVTRVVADAKGPTLCHLVVRLDHGEGPPRLVPTAQVEVTRGIVWLGVPAAGFAQLEAAEETERAAVTVLGSSSGRGGAPAWVQLAVAGGMGLGMAGVCGPLPVIHEKVPFGEVTVRRGECVHATDGRIGRVQGIEIDPEDHHVTGVILEEGHFWRRRCVAIPGGAVVQLHEGIQVAITRHEVASLPPLRLERHARGSARG